MTRFIVTTSASGQSKTEIWDPELPLSLGYPLRWIAERTERGVRIRSLGSRPGEITEASGSITEIPHAQIESGVEFPLPESRGMSIRIRPASRISPAFGGTQGNRLSIFCCSGDWVLSSFLFSDHYQGLMGPMAVFSMRKTAEAYSFEIGINGVSIHTGSEPPRELKQGESAQVRVERMAETVISYGRASWRFGLSPSVDFPGPSAQFEKIIDAETRWFRKALRYTAVAFAAFIMMSWVWPKQDSQELIPAQYAKIVLSRPAPQPKTKASASEGNPIAGSAPEKIQKAAIVQAFRAKALNRAISGLLKGGMTSLLAQADFVAGRGATANARSLFDSKSSALQATGPTGAVGANTNRAVAGLGGSGQGKGAGYGTGEHAGITGQGQAFVSMDIAGAVVDEGLTKDEVGAVIHRHLSEVRYCYESAMVRTPDLEGKLMVNFTIGGAGSVKSTEVRSSTLPDPRLDDCILRRLMTWKFPSPRGGIDVAVTYPFIFKTLGS